jgi:hypothetical protein
MALVPHDQSGLEPKRCGPTLTKRLKCSEPDKPFSVRQRMEFLATASDPSEILNSSPSVNELLRGLGEKPPVFGDPKNGDALANFTQRHFTTDQGLPSASWDVDLELVSGGAGLPCCCDRILLILPGSDGGSRTLQFEFE